MNAILKHLDNDTLVRRDWGDGEKYACLYSALVPGATSTDNCPAEIMPQWLADVTFSLTDNVSESGWAGRMRRYGEASARWNVLSDDQWEFVRRQWGADCIEVVLRHAEKVEHGDYWADVQKSCQVIFDVLRANQDPTLDQINAARAAGDAVGAVGPAWATEAAAWAAEAAADAAAWAAEAAARAAAREAARTAVKAVWAVRATGTAAEAAWDNLFDMLMDRIEAECAKSEM